MKLKIFLICIAFLIQGAAYAGAGKTVYLPKNLSTVPEGNNFNDNNSEYSNKRSYQSANFVMYWSKEYGDNPMANQDISKRFDIKRLLIESERFYAYYAKTLKVIIEGRSISDKHKIIFLITGGENNTAYAWGGEDKVGILWTPASRINKEPYGVIAHELGHVFQFFANIDHNKTSFNGTINEMGAQYLLWQVYPEWTTFENFHLKDFVKNSYKAFLHPDNAYHSPFLLEYWSEKHGKHFYGKMLREVEKNEDPVETYKRITQINQDQFNNEVFEAASKFVTWDLKRIEQTTKQYANQHSTILKPMADSWYRISSENCPENYGYNAIKLNIPKVGNMITAQLRGIVGTEGFTNSNPSNAGWHFGFVAYNKDGTRFYGKIQSENEQLIPFKVPEETTNLWLVVSGAPKNHNKLKRNSESQDQWPYEVKVNGAELSL